MALYRPHFARPSSSHSSINVYPLRKINMERFSPLRNAFLQIQRPIRHPYCIIRPVACNYCYLNGYFLVPSSGHSWYSPAMIDKQGPGRQAGRDNVKNDATRKYNSTRESQIVKVSKGTTNKRARNPTHLKLSASLHFILCEPPAAANGIF